MTCRRRDLSFESCTLYTAVLRRASRRRAAAWWPAEQACSRTHRVRRSDDRFQRANFVRLVHRSSATASVALCPHGRRSCGVACLLVSQAASIIQFACRCRDTLLLRGTRASARERSTVSTSATNARGAAAAPRHAKPLRAANDCSACVTVSAVRRRQSIYSSKYAE